MSGNLADFKNILPDFVKTDAELEMYKLRHSTEHVFAQAVTSLYPGKVKLAVAHISENTFANDAKWEIEMNEERFAEIEQKMQEIIDRNLPFIRKEVSVEEARELLKDNKFKLEWLEQFAAEDKTITMYWTGDEYVDLCKGPHLNSTGEIKAFKLLNVAGAYWRGDEKNEMLTRVYGTAFGSKAELDHYIEMQEEAKRRDHRLLGPKLDLFMFHETAPGMPYWLPNGLKLYNKLVDYWRTEHNKWGYREIASPLINKSELWKISGHWDHYKDDMFIADMGENEIYGVKPMNCPNAMLVFKSKQISYRDLPYRLSDTDRLHRYERSGTLNGLLRVRSFQQDDSHNFISEDMVASEYNHIFEVCKQFYGLFGLEYSFRLGTRPESFMGDLETWDKAEADLRQILDDSGKNYIVEEGDGAFYGPKIDILMHDALGREWQMGTIQLDFQIPRRFELSYIDKDGNKQTPVVIHRVIYGSLERFIGIIIEHFGGAFPAWMSPEQIRIIPIKDEHVEYANKLQKELYSAGIHVEVDDSAERMQNKIRKAQEMKVPYMLIVGGQEAADETVSVRLRTGEEIKGMKFSEFQEKLLGNIRSRKLELGL